MNWKHLLIGTAAASLLAACANPKPPETAVEPSTSNASAPAAAVTPAPIDPLNDPNSLLAQRSVYFDLDSFVVNEDFRKMIEAHAGYLKGKPDQHIKIEGNTDARGSSEYNLALGNKRAQSVANSLMVLGVSSDQIETVSFGKEKPKAMGNTDADYAQNRRADIVYGQQ